LFFGRGLSAESLKSEVDKNKLAAEVIQEAVSLDILLKAMEPNYNAAISAAPIDHVVENPAIFIGNLPAASDAALLKRHAIASILSLNGAGSEFDAESRGVTEIRVFDLHDGPGNQLATYVRAIDALNVLAHCASPVLVHCQAGVSRSPAVVVGYLIKYQGLSREAALIAVGSKRPGMRINPELQKLIRQL